MVEEVVVPVVPRWVEIEVVMVVAAGEVMADLATAHTVMSCHHAAHLAT